MTSGDMANELILALDSTETSLSWTKLETGLFLTMIL